jgi:hypothetical protein
VPDVAVVSEACFEFLDDADDDSDIDDDNTTTTIWTTKSKQPERTIGSAKRCQSECQ